MKFASIFILTVVLTQCSKTKSDNPTHINIKECGQYVYSGETTRLCFDEVVSDSRCPANVVCVWEGTAVAKFSFQKGNESYPLTLATRAVNNLYSKDTTIAGYKIEFINLVPYPISEPSPNPPLSKAEVKVTKL